jgi:hypothetical protein
MPRSKDPIAFATFWFNLVEAMAESEGPFTFTLPHKVAVERRNEWYSFRRALYRHRRIGPDTTGEEAQRFSRLYRATGGWEALFRPTPRDAPTAAERTLIFRRKDSQSTIRTMQHELDHQLGRDSTPVNRTLPSASTGVLDSLGYTNPRGPVKKQPDPEG